MGVMRMSFEGGVSRNLTMSPLTQREVGGSDNKIEEGTP
jgi:hypothetical protein